MPAASPAHAALARQALGRPLTEAEEGLAKALETIFVSGQHDIEAVARGLQQAGVARPSGEGGPWTAAVLERELALINAQLDEAYAARDSLAAAGRTN
jgi:hypothetical protein